jgi:hypothetical protein
VSLLIPLSKNPANHLIQLTCNFFLRLYAFELSNNRLCHYYIKDFLDHVNKATTIGRKIQGSQWYKRLCNTSTYALKDYLDLLSSKDYKYRIESLYKLLDISCDHSKFIIHFFISKYIFQDSVELTDSKQVKEALARLKEFNYHYEECKLTLKYYEHDYDVFDIDSEELEELYDDYLVQTCVVDGLHSKVIAQDLLKKCFDDDEILNMDLLFDVIDWYRDAIIKTRDNDVECEAEVSSDLGFIYDDVLKRKERAKQYYQNSWHLAESLKPKVFTRFKWFIKCSLAIQRYQKEVYDEERKTLDAERDKVMKDIKDDIEKIKKKESDHDPYKFLEFIYKDYRPKNPKHVLIKNLEASNIQKAVREAIIHYHPDKNSKDMFGSKWFFISEEITKILNIFYSHFKS